MIKTLIIIFFTLLVGILIAIGLIFFLTRKVKDIRHKKKLKQLYKSSPYRDKKPSNKVNIKLKKRNVNIQHDEVEPEANVTRYDEFEKEADTIVDIVKPIGKWTAFIIKSKTHLVRHVGKFGKHYWVNLIKMQVPGQGKHKGRGR